ncbi:hypothetical protein J1605_021949 [Eschrichtius robustus]|uniref:Uncharacterized protein n=1 Tax=Eschrichtius robustus TaxID=9764 RepID=A0AB34H9G4_ESCRO|nr:hypothetical protein J1605_021949 [Eschrichtius robustus]
MPVFQPPDTNPRLSPAIP